MTNDALHICQSAIDAVNPQTAIQTHVSLSKGGTSILIHDVSSSSTSSSTTATTIATTTTTTKSLEYHAKDYDQIYIFAFGKASSAMAYQTTQILSSSNHIPPISGGIIICKDDHATHQERQFLAKYNIDIKDASHPIPDERSVNATQDIGNTISSIPPEQKERTLIIHCISGGGSSLYTLPLSRSTSSASYSNSTSSLTLSDIAQTNKQLLASGMSINQINIIRKRLDQVKGGRTATHCHPCTSLTLVLSDVVNDPLDMIASGPIVPDDVSTWNLVWELMLEFDLVEGGAFELPIRVLELMKEGLEGLVEDTPKSSHAMFSTPIPALCNNNGDTTTNDGDDSSDNGRIIMRCETILVGNNVLAVQAAATKAKSLGYNPVILGTSFEGEAKEIAQVYISMAAHLQSQQHDGKKE